MSHVLHGDEPDVFTGSHFLFRIFTAEFVRNIRIRSAVDQNLLCSNALFGRRGFTVMFGNFCWRAAQKSGNSIIAQVQFPCATQVKHAGQRKHASDRRFVRGKAECKLATGGMSGNAEASEIELRKFAFRFIAMHEMVCAAKIVERSRPSAARIANAPVFDVVCRDAGHFQSMAEMARVREIVFRAPVAAMNEKHDWMRPIAFGQANIHKLIRVLAVGEAQIGVRRRCGEYVLAWHGRAV